jgi:hypothetical protein
MVDLIRDLTADELEIVAGGLYGAGMFTNVVSQLAGSCSSWQIRKLDGSGTTTATSCPWW